jgi:cell filamentation protein
MNKYDYRYEAPDNYVYDGTSVLINKLDIRDDRAFRDVERRFTAGRLVELSNTPIRGHFGFTHLKKIHAYIFQDLYEWAGKPRQAGFLSKGGTIFCRGEYIDSQAEQLFGKLQAEKLLRGYDKPKFIERLAYFMGEVNALHPFREGNGRTCREFFRELSLCAGYVLDWGNADKDDLLVADVAAFERDYAPLAAILDAIVH